MRPFLFAALCAAAVQADVLEDVKEAATEAISVPKPSFTV
jgi:hypothetical protein